MYLRALLYSQISGYTKKLGLEDWEIDKNYKAPTLVIESPCKECINMWVVALLDLPFPIANRRIAS